MSLLFSIICLDIFYINNIFKLKLDKNYRVGYIYVYLFNIFHFVELKTGQKKPVFEEVFSSLVGAIFI